MDNRMKITDVTGPYREPREQVFSYDYSIQRASWPTAQAIRVKVAIPEELDVLRSKILGAVEGTPGQQLMISRFLSRHIADEKIRIADADGMLSERRDTVVAPFTGPLAYLFPRLEAWAAEQKEPLREEIKTLVGPHVADNHFTDLLYIFLQQFIHHVGANKTCTANNQKTPSTNIFLAVPGSAGPFWIFLPATLAAVPTNLNNLCCQPLLLPKMKPV